MLAYADECLNPVFLSRTARLRREVASSAAMSITVTLPDGTPLELADGATGADAAAAIGSGLARAALAIEVSHPQTGGDGGESEVRDLARPSMAFGCGRGLPGARKPEDGGKGPLPGASESLVFLIGSLKK